MSTETIEPASSVAGAEGGFGSKPTDGAVDLLEQVQAQLVTDGHLPPESDDRQKKPNSPESKDTGEPKEMPKDEVKDGPKDGAKAVSEEDPQTEPKKDSAKAKPKKEWPESAQHRVSELSAAKKQAETEAAELRVRLAELESKEPEAAKPGGDNPLAGSMRPVHGYETVEQVETEMERVDWTLEHLERIKDAGYEMPDTQGVAQTYAPEMVQQAIREARRRQRELPRVLKQLGKRDEHRTGLLAKHSAWWGRTEDERYQRVQSILRAVPELRRLPEHELLLADYAASALATTSADASDKPEAEAPKQAKKPDQDTEPEAAVPPPVPDGSGSAQPGLHRQAGASGSGMVTKAEIEGIQHGDHSALNSVVARMLARGNDN